jgi:hypothetical protein
MTSLLILQHQPLHVLLLFQLLLLLRQRFLIQYLCFLQTFPFLLLGYAFPLDELLVSFSRIEFPVGRNALIEVLVEVDPILVLFLQIRHAHPWLFSILRSSILFDFSQGG